MSQAKQLLEELNRMARVAKAIAEDAVDLDGNGKIDWKDLLAAPGSDDFRGTVDRLLKQTSRAEVLAALAAVNKRKIQLRNGRSFTQMSDEELEQYSALRATENILHKTADRIEQDRSRFIAWLVDDALPVLARTLKLVLPVLR